MKVVATRQNANGTYDSVGMSNRTLLDYKTEAGVLRSLARSVWAASGKPFTVRLEWFNAVHIYGEPCKVTFHTVYPNKRKQPQ